MTRATSASPFGERVRRVPGPSGGGAGIALTPKDILSVFRRRLWLIVIVTMVSTLLSLVLWYFLKRYYPRYTSQAAIRAKMPAQPNILTGRWMIPREEVLAGEAAQKAAYLENQFFMSSVLKRTLVQQTNWFKKFEDNPDKTIEALKDGLSASPMRMSGGLVRLGMTARDRMEAQLILSEVLLEFEQQMTAEANRDLTSRLAAANKQADALDSQLIRRRRELGDIARQANSAGWETGRPMVLEQVRDLDREVLIAGMQLEDALARRKRLEEERRQSGQMYSSGVQASVDQHPMVRALRNRIVGLLEEKDRLLDRLGQEHWEVAEMEARIQSAQRQLDEENAKLLAQYNGQEQMSVAQDVETAQKNLESAKEKLEIATSRQSELDSMMRRREEIQSHIAQDEKELTRYKQLIGETKLSMEDSERIRAEVAARGGPAAGDQLSEADDVPSGWIDVGFAAVSGSGVAVGGFGRYGEEPAGRWPTPGGAFFGNGAVGR